MEDTQHLHVEWRMGRPRACHLIIPILMLVRIYDFYIAQEITSTSEYFACAELHLRFA